MRNKKVAFFLAAVWTVVVTFLSLASIDTSVGNEIHIPNKDKMVHFVFYFLFVFLWTFFANFKKIVTNSSLKILLIAVFYGIMMEVFQELFTTDRTADVFDVVANSCGALVGYFAINRYLKNKTL